MRILGVLCTHRPKQHARVQPRGVGRRDGDLKLTLEDQRRDRDKFRNATLVEFLRQEKLGKTGAGPFGEPFAMLAPPSVLGEIVYEPAEMAPVSNRYLDRVSHRLTGDAALVPAHRASYSPLTPARAAGGIHGHG
jgi:hypothetical protein